MIDRVTNDIDQLMKAGFLGIIALLALIYLSDYEGITQILHNTLEWFGGPPIR